MEVNTKAIPTSKNGLYLIWHQKRNEEFISKEHHYNNAFRPLKIKFASVIFVNSLKFKGTLPCAGLCCDER